MPAGQHLATSVLRLLDYQKGKTPAQIALEIRPPVTSRSVRYALKELFATGRAKRLGKSGQHYKAIAVREAIGASA